MIRYIYCRHLCRKAVARAFHGRIMKGKSPLPEFPTRIEIEPHETLTTLLTCTHNKRAAHPQDDNECNCRKNAKHGDHQLWAFVVPLNINKKADA